MFKVDAGSLQNPSFVPPRPPVGYSNDRERWSELVFTIIGIPTLSPTATFLLSHDLQHRNRPSI